MSTSRLFQRLFAIISLSILLVEPVSGLSGDQINIIEKFGTEVMSANVVEFDGQQTLIVGDATGHVYLFNVKNGLSLQTKINYFDGVDITPTGETILGGLVDKNVSMPSDICPIDKPTPGNNKVEKRTKKFIVTNNAETASFRVYNYQGELQYSNSKYSRICSVWFNKVFALSENLPELAIHNLKSSRQHHAIDFSLARDAISSKAPPGKTFIKTSDSRIFSVHQPSGNINLLAKPKQYLNDKNKMISGKLKLDPFRKELMLYNFPNIIHRIDQETGSHISSQQFDSQFEDFDVNENHVVITRAGAIIILSYPELKRKTGKVIFEQPAQTHVKWIGNNKLVVYGNFGASSAGNIIKDKIALIKFKPKN